MNPRAAGQGGGPGSDPSWRQKEGEGSHFTCSDQPLCPHPASSPKGLPEAGLTMRDESRQGGQQAPAWDTGRPAQGSAAFARTPPCTPHGQKRRWRLEEGSYSLELQGKDPTPGCLVTVPGPQEQKGQGSQQGPEEGLMARGGDSLTSASSSVLSCPKQDAPDGAG